MKYLSEKARIAHADAVVEQLVRSLRYLVEQVRAEGVVERDEEHIRVVEGFALKTEQALALARQDR